MSNSSSYNKIKNDYAKTSSGSINYQHYDNQARNIRSESVWALFKSIFSDKESSSVEDTEECHVMIFNNAEKNLGQSTSIQLVA